MDRHDIIQNRVGVLHVPRGSARRGPSMSRSFWSPSCFSRSGTPARHHGPRSMTAFADSFRRQSRVRSWGRFR
jgi:hypothetical protein